MEMIPVTELKLKIIMKKEDLKKFELRADDLDYGTTETKKMLWSLLADAKRDYGFDTDGYRILVQLFPSKDGGCELFITKTECFPSFHTDKQLHYKRSYEKSETEERVSAFSFERMEYLLSVCRRLHAIGYGERSEAYISDEGRYYLFLDGLDPVGHLIPDEFSFVREYGTNENEELIRSFLCEHGRIICENAVERLGVL